MKILSIIQDIKYFIRFYKTESAMSRVKQSRPILICGDLLVNKVITRKL